MVKDTTRTDTALPNALVRKRWSLRRKLGVAASLAALAVVLFIGREVLLLLTAKVNPSIDYPAQRNALVLKAAEQRVGGPVTDGATQWAQLDSLLTSTLQHDKEFGRQFVGVPTDPANPPRVSFDLVFGELGAKDTPADAALAKAAFEQHQRLGTRASLERSQQLLGATRPTPENKPILDFNFPSTASVRHNARLLGAFLTQAIRERDSVAAVSSLRSLLALGAIVSSQGTLVDGLLGIAAQALAAEVLTKELAQNAPPELVLLLFNELQNAPAIVSFDDVVEQQRIELLDAAQWTHAENGRFVPSQLAALDSAQSPQAGFSDLVAGYYARRTESEQIIERLCAEHKQRARLPLAERPPAEVDAYINGLGRRYLFVRALRPTLDKAATAFAAFQTTRNGTLILLALEAHAAKHGSYPTSLASLVPEFFATLPKDAVAPDGAFRYTLRTPTPEDSRPYLLYSVGIDGRDNAGAANEPAFHQALSSTKDGTGQDYVFNRPREPKAD